MGKEVIKAENLGKKYFIGHKTKKAAYSSLREEFILKTTRGLKKTYNLFKGQQLLAGNEIEEFWALKNLDFTINQGDRIGIIGKNGAGKSTLLKVLSRITEPSEGKVTIHGRIASLLEVGTGFHPELTGRENIYLNGAVLGMNRSEIKSKFDEIVSFAEVENFLDTPVKRYSSGMYVRLAFAVAAHLEPEILVVDEVLAVGDAEFQKKCLGKMEDVSKEDGRTVLFVSHNMNAVTNLCQKAILLEQGKMKFQGPVNNTINEYLNSFTQANKKVVYHEDKAPSGEMINLLSAEVRPGEGYGEMEYIETGDAIEIEFNFKNLSEKQRILDITFHLMDEMNNLVFVGSTGFSEIKSGSYENGLLKFFCQIPAGLMNEGYYNISRLLVVQNGGTAIFEHKDTIQFEIVAKQSGNLGWMGKKEGIVLPTLKWSV